MTAASDGRSSSQGTRASERTRRRLIDAAAEVIAERGYQAASLTDIATRAGLTTGAVYSAFGSKQALLVAVCTDAAESAITPADGGAGASHSLRADVEESARAAAGAADDPGAQRVIRLQLEMLKLSLRDRGIFDLLAAYAREQVAADGERLRRLGEAEGIHLGEDAERLAIVLTATLNGLAQLRLVNADLAPEELFLWAADRLFHWEPDATNARRKSTPAARPSTTARRRRPAAGA